MLLVVLIFKVPIDTLCCLLCSYSKYLLIHYAACCAHIQSSYAVEENKKMFWTVFGYFLERASEVTGKLEFNSKMHDLQMTSR